MISDEELKSDSPIRTRFAPSPTGFLHVGGLRSALFEYLFARNRGGDFVLRIEDTDRSRYVEGSIENLIKTLEWAGLDYDEGVYLKDGQLVEKGHHGPYQQSKRLGIYKQYIKKLVDEGKAYYCFCAPERLRKMRQQQEKNKMAPKYDRHCLKMTPGELNKKLAAGIPGVVRMKVPDKGEIVVDDGVRGQVKFQLADLDDQVLMKSDGYPTYHLAVVIDDYLMGISDVIRGEEWLPSTPKHLLLYKYFGWQPPRYYHLPLLVDKNRAKLSKRRGDVAVEDFRRQGYLPEALINFVALLGWNPGDEREIFSLSELVKEFFFEKVNKAPAVFDYVKLDWINGQYIRGMEPKKLLRKCLPYLIEDGFIAKDGQRMKFVKMSGRLTEEYLLAVIKLAAERMKKLSEVGQLSAFFFEEIPGYPRERLIWKKLSLDQIGRNLSWLKEILQNRPENKFEKEELEGDIMAAIKSSSKGVGDILWPFRVALTGREKSPGPFEVAAILGKARVLARVEAAEAKIAE